MPTRPPDLDADLPDASGQAGERPSKSQRKRDMTRLQVLGEQFADLPQARIDAAAIPQALRDAIHEYRRTRSHEGRRRQMQYIGKLMRQCDPAPIEEAVLAMQAGRARDAMALHRAERWRDELLACDDALTRWLAEHPDTDVQHLRSLLRAARKDASADPGQRHGRAYRELFQFLKPYLGGGDADDAATTTAEDHHD